jgi:predicted HAD superfamily Cof-like phosphohydrolase
MSSSDFQYLQDVKLFHDKFGLVTPDSFTHLEDSLHNFRTGFFYEELTEYEDAARDGDLATTLDSLIDLVYIISGAALLHGITPDELYGAMAIVDDFFDEDAVLRDGILDEDPNEICLPDPLIAGIFTTIMTDLIECYDSIHKSDMVRDTRKLYVKCILAAMFTSSMVAAGYQGCTEELWNDLWTDVQRANMSKERALKASDSKRGSTYDVIKPVGWTPPQTEEIIAKHQTVSTLNKFFLGRAKND